MRKLLIALLMAGTGMVTACNSEDPNDGENYLDFIPAPAGLICVAVECKSDADCTDAATPNCAFQTGECAECAVDQDCVELAGTSTVYEGRELCRGFTCVCSSDQFCQDSGAGAVCVPGTGSCAECGRDSDCTDAASPACIGAGTPAAFCGCGSDTDCGNDQQCIAGVCECAADSACPAGFTCDVERAECFECEPVSVAEDCPADRPLCASRLCVECTNNDECTGARETCEDNVCVQQECVEDGDCTAPQFCDGNTCTDPACSSDADCADNPGGTFCRNAGTSSAECTCENDSHCSTAGRTKCYFGDSSARYCGCANDADCSAGNEGDTCIPGDFNRSNASGCTCSADAQCGDAATNSCRTPP